MSVCAGVPDWSRSSVLVQVCSCQEADLSVFLMGCNVAGVRG